MEEKKIPFVKPERVGNYKLWRSKVALSYSPSDEERAKVRKESGGREKLVTKKIDIEAINISNLDGSWKVQIPSTSEMFGLITQHFADESDKDNEFLGMLFANFLNISLSANPVLHDGLFLLTEMLSFPYLLLPEKEMIKRMKAVYKKNGIDKKDSGRQIDDMVAYRKEVYDLIDEKIARLISDYERIRTENSANEGEHLKALAQDEVADEAMNILNKENEE